MIYSAIYWPQMTKMLKWNFWPLKLSVGFKPVFLHISPNSPTWQAICSFTNWPATRHRPIHSLSPSRCWHFIPTNRRSCMSTSWMYFLLTDLQFAFIWFVLHLQAD
jgi:hypothetical protein